MTRTRTGILVIDLQTDMFSGAMSPPIHDAETLVARTRAILGWARRNGRKVAFIRHDGPAGDPLAPGQPGWPVWPALGQTEDEPTFSKAVGDAFSQPAFLDWLSAHEVGEVVLLGAQTDCCVAATVAGALQHSLQVTVVGDAHSTWDSGGESAAQIIARHNASFTATGARVITTDELVAE